MTTTTTTRRYTHNSPKATRMVVVVAALVSVGSCGGLVQGFITIKTTTRTTRQGVSSLYSSTTSTTSTSAPTTEEMDLASTATIKATTTNSNNKSFLDDGFVFGLEGSGLERPQGKVAQIVVEGDSLETQPWQQGIVWGTLGLELGLMLYAMTQLLAHQALLPTMAESFVALGAAYVLADLGSGILHWSVDNYGNGRTPIMGGIIAAFQGHHSAPWTITEREFANNVYKLCIPFGPVTTGILALVFRNHPAMTLFFTSFCLLEILSQEFHKWSHMTKSQVPGWVNTLQNVGLTIGRKPHAQHHLAPYEGNYCIISGICNPWLDQTGFFRRLEHVIYQWNGVESNAWKLDPQLKAKTLNGDYALDTE